MGDTIGSDGSRPEYPDTEQSRRWRIRHDWKNLIEDLIEDGHRRGVFDDLAGQGKPLDLGKNPYEGNMALANKLLKDNDLLPAWLQQHVEVDQEIAKLRSEIKDTWRRFELAFDQAQGDTQRGGLTLGWDKSCRRWEEEIVRLNKQIESFNLRRPGQALEIFKLNLTSELGRVKAPRYLL